MRSISVFFAMSGFCSLVYEVVWLRLAMASFGVTTMISVVVSMFMAGLGAGSWALGSSCAGERLAFVNYAFTPLRLLVGTSSDSPPPPRATGSSLLYSREFYQIIKKHLSPGGILQIWYPLADGDPAIVASVTKAAQDIFRYVRAFLSFFLSFDQRIPFLASMQPLQIPSSAIASRLPVAAAADLLECAQGATAETHSSAVLSQESSLNVVIALDARVLALSDDQPINEYFLRAAGLARTSEIPSLAVMPS
jgi:hypothetical protein